MGWLGRRRRRLPHRVEGLDVELLPIALSRRGVEDCYHGFANRTLWPLLHGLIEQPVFERRWWRAYRDVNERFAAVEVGGGGLRWVHDYHLMLGPSLLRGAQEELRDALQCNPFELAGLGGTIGEALELDEGERRRRIERMAAAVARRDVYWWTEQELAAAREIREAA